MYIVLVSSIRRPSPKVTIIINVIIVIATIIIITVTIIFKIAERHVYDLLLRLFCYIKLPSVNLHFPSYINAQFVVVHLDNNLL